VTENKKCEELLKGNRRNYKQINRRAPAQFGFVAPPAFFFVILAVILILYLLAVEGMKQWFFRRFAAE